MPNDAPYPRPGFTYEVSDEQLARFAAATPRAANSRVSAASASGASASNASASARRASPSIGASPNLRLRMPSTITTSPAADA